MGQQSGIRAETVIMALHRLATRELLRLLDGFYGNIEDGLFELAYRTGEEGQRRRCFDLMRDLRFRRSGLVKAFARTMEGYRGLWLDPRELRDSRAEHGHDLERLVMRMAEKSTAHFGGVLLVIGERASQATGVTFATADTLPISPRRVASAFVASCRTLKLDHGSIEIVQELFSRFVLDGLGAVYGECNHYLRTQGFPCIAELELASTG